MFKDYEVTHEPAPPKPSKLDWIGYGLLLALLVIAILYALAAYDAVLAARMV